MRGDVLPWLEYTWSFDFPTGMFRAIVERLRGTPARLEEMFVGCGGAVRSRQVKDAWSAQEHAGHLVVVELLWRMRLEEYRQGVATLTAADMANRKTAGAGFNERSLDEILSEFRRARRAFVATLDVLPVGDANRAAHHPRLGRPIRLVDLCYFAAEHDDHHLAAIHDLLLG